MTKRVQANNVRRHGKRHGLKTLRTGVRGRYVVVDDASGDVLTPTLVGLVELERALDVQVAERKLIAARRAMPRDARRRRAPVAG